MRPFLLLAVFLPALSLSTGCDARLFTAEIQAPEICATGLGFSVPPAISEVVADRPLSLADLGFELPQIDSGDLLLEVAVLGVGVVPDSGVDDLRFLDHLRVQAVPSEGSALPPLELIQMSPDDHMSDGAIYAEPDGPVDLAEHLRAGAVSLAVDLQGELPEVAWSSALEVCVEVVASY